MSENKQVKIKMKKINPSEIKNDDLKNALEVLKNERNTKNEAEMLSLLQKAELLAPVLFQGPDPQHLQIKFILLNTKDGKQFFPAFTDEEEAKKLNVPSADENAKEQKGRSYIIRNILDYRQIFADPNNKAEGVVVNPMSSNIVIPKNLIVKLYDARVDAAKARQKAAAMPAGMQISYSEPRIYPTSLINAVYDECQKLDGVQRVWFKQMNIGMSISFALIVEADDFNAVKDVIHDTAAAKAKDVPVVVLQYTPELQKHAIKESVPMYDKALEF